MLFWGWLYEAERGSGVFWASTVVAGAAFLVSLSLKKQKFIERSDGDND
jgi:hypothetical protein